ncbi:MAG: NADH-quinone oxidoreductase subunit L [Alphaproteobacteria bacterium]|nr:NADH-quinone oxidoreductase subunit L [Alphaproteobacteria bacterium]
MNAILIVFLPLLVAVISGLLVRRLPVIAVQILTCGAMVTSAALSGFEFYNVAVMGDAYTVPLMDWVTSGDFGASWSLRVDVLTAVMLVVVTWVSAVVHLYSTGYMSHDDHQQRFMAYLSLFTFCMLMLVTADNFLQLFFGWEGVGLSSYLLIGFWFKKESANAAAIKAFLVNRVGDFGFALGICAVFAVFGTIDFNSVFTAAASKNDVTYTFLGQEFHALTLICVLLFIGAMGKSAQLGLHTWLPDAMEGPTPVSALIHAATMVTAGVFLVARCSPLFELSPFALNLVTVVGGVTCVFAATVALVQNDIKRIIAYSTCSQLGYMFFACGVSAYSAGIFHLMTHAFFKALLFLGAGCVIHAMSDEQDIRKMGGIWKKIPVTYAYMWIGSLALMGVFPFAGYYSKDLILEAAYASGSATGQFAAFLGFVAAFCTAFYSTRLTILVFHGKPRASHDVMHHVHESPSSMIVPMALLMLGAIFSGYIGSSLLHMGSADLAFWRGTISVAEGHDALEHAHHVPAIIKFLPMILGAAGIFLAWLLYSAKPEIPGKLAVSLKPVYSFLLNKWYFDELYDFLFVRPAQRFGRHLWKLWDAVVIDGFGPNGIAWASQFTGRGLSKVQSGYLYHYALAMLLGIVALVSWFALGINK